MPLIVRSCYIKPKDISPCVDCNDRQVGCHSQCAKYNEWKNTYLKRKKAIKDYNRKIARCEEYEICQRLKNSKKKCGER